MPRPFSEYTGQFFWDFKRMDNVNYNFSIVEILYTAKKANRNNTHFNKPITILLIAMIECMLYDLIIRIRTHMNDPFPNMNWSIVSFFRGKRETDELKVIITNIQAQNLLRANPGDTIYADLEHLRCVRNRVHIQNRWNTLDRDEPRVFTDAELQTAEQCFEKVCEVLCNVYPRWNKQPLPMVDFPRPWI